MFKHIQKSSLTVDDHYLNCEQFQVKSSVLEGCEFRGTTRILVSNDLTLSYRKSVGKLSEHAYGEEGQIHFCFPVGNQRLYQNGYLHHERSQIVCHADRSMLAIYPAEFDFYGCILNLDKYGRILSATEFEALVKVLAHTRIFERVNVHKKQVITSAIHAMIENAAFLADLTPDNEPLVEDLMSNLYLRMFDYLVETDAMQIDMPICRRRQLISRCLDYLDTTDIFAVSLVTLSHAVHSSQRNIQYAFRQMLGMSAIQYLRLRRMVAIRNSILASGKDESITHILDRHNILNAGRFAMEYRRLFGEFPSCTRKAVHGKARVRSHGV